MSQSHASQRPSSDKASRRALELPKIRKRDRGQVLLLAAMSMVVMIGFVALATDVGLLWNARRQMAVVVFLQLLHSRVSGFVAIPVV